VNTTKWDTQKRQVQTQPQVASCPNSLHPGCCTSKLYIGNLCMYSNFDQNTAQEICRTSEECLVVNSKATRDKARFLDQLLAVQDI
jgi:hypothetical protein